MLLEKAAKGVTNQDGVCDLVLLVSVLELEKSLEAFLIFCQRNVLATSEFFKVLSLVSFSAHVYLLCNHGFIPPLRTHWCEKVILDP